MIGPAPERKVEQRLEFVGGDDHLLPGREAAGPCKQAHGTVEVHGRAGQDQQTVLLPLGFSRVRLCEPSTHT